MSKRMYSTKTKKLPTQKEVEKINKVCEKMILDKRVIIAIQIPGRHCGS